MRRLLSVLMILVICGVSFAAGAEAAAADGHALTRFYFSRWGELVPRTWEVVREGDGFVLTEDEEEPRPFPAELAAALEQAIADYGMEKWNGEYSTEYEVLDGECFSLQMEFADGTSVSAYGNNAFPPRYFEAMGAVDEIFEREKRGTLAGTYRYEKEGFGGDFTITLNADGTFAFSEGPLSSYLGEGSWYVAFGSADLYEGDTGTGLSFSFGIGENSLIYLAWGSDPFPHVELPDGARFIRLEEE